MPTVIQAGQTQCIGPHGLADDLIPSPHLEGDGVLRAQVEAGNCQHGVHEHNILFLEPVGEWHQHEGST